MSDMLTQFLTACFGLLPAVPADSKFDASGRLSAGTIVLLPSKWLHKCSSENVDVRFSFHSSMLECVEARWNSDRSQSRVEQGQSWR